MRRFLLRVEGGGPIGLGHVVRSRHLADKLVQKGLDCAGLWCDCEVSIVENIWKGMDNVVRVLDNSAVYDAIYHDNLELLIVDQRTDFAPICRELKAHVPSLLTVALDPPVIDSTAFDIVISLFMHGTECFVDYDPKRHFCGIEYAIIRSEFLTRTIRPVDCDISNLLVTCGGTDPSRVTVTIVNALQKMAPLPFQVNVVIGPGFKNADEVKAAASGLNIYENVANISQLMEECDLGIVSSGSTLMEMCLMGRPTLSFAHNAAEERFAQYFYNRGATKFMGLAEKLDQMNVVDSLKALCRDKTVRKQMSQLGVELIDGRGIERVVQLVNCMR